MESTELFQRSFGDADASEDIGRLVASLRVLRTNVGKLTSRIAGALPGLSIHDVSHLDALWEVARTLAGPDYPLNALEAYVFGAAVLLHDAGLCFEAYSGGRDSVRRSQQWNDAHSRLRRAGYLDEELELETDFQTLRALHAAQAVRLGTQAWESEEGEFYLIDDRELRENYGSLIGSIASSHHWDLDEVVNRFSTPRPASAFFDNNWPVDSLKIACMLRVADAGHIDGARAPSFLTRILQMNSLSRVHWVAQSRLGRLTIRPDHPEQVMVGSTSPFPSSEAAAWWVAYDLVDNFDRELRRCNELLATSAVQSRRAFAKRSVAGAGHVRELARYVQTEGWQPIESTVCVSNVAALVHAMGEKQLFRTDSDRLSGVLRELLHNASDAINARKNLAGGDGFESSIAVRLKGDADDGWTLHVDDNGVGMAQSTLTTDLLDFGRSFWYSEQAANQFPGLQSSGFAPIGRFGIGFFSVFMAAKRVRVFSRRYDKGLDDTWCLSFDNGISLRPTLSSDRPDDFDMRLCTRVELALTLSVTDTHTDEFEEVVRAIAAPLGLPITVEAE